MTLVEVIDAARALLNEPRDSSSTFPDNTSGFWSDSILTNYFNRVQEEVAAELVQVYEDFFVTQTTVSIVAGTTDYSLPSDFVKMRRLEQLSGSNDPLEIQPISMNDPGSYVGLDIFSATSPYGGYFLRGTQLVLGNTPTVSQPSGVRMFYVQRLPEIASGTSTSPIPQEFHRALVWGVVKYALHQQQSDNNFATIEYEKHIAKIRQQAEDRQVQRSRQVKRRKHRGPLR